jgi:hypothetical protein
MKINKHHLTPALSPNPTGGEGEKVMRLIEAKAGVSKDPEAMVPAPSSLPEMFLNTIRFGNSGLRAVNLDVPGRTGVHPQTSVRIHRTGHQPTAPVIFYRQ